MAYIRARVCGRKFIDDRNINYFLYQQGKMPYLKEPAVVSKGPIAKDSSEAWVAQFRVQAPNGEPKVIELPEKVSSDTPIFYDVVNNEVIVLDSKKDIRQLKLATYSMNKDFSKHGDLIFQANCQNGTYSVSGGGQVARTEALSNSKDDMPNVAFNRACGDHGDYMQFGSKGK
jgi:hypothetical protein